MVLIWVAALGADDGQWLMVAAFGVPRSSSSRSSTRRCSSTAARGSGHRAVIDAPRLVVAGGARRGSSPSSLGVAVAPALPGGDEPLFETGGLGATTAERQLPHELPPLLDVGDKLHQRRAAGRCSP